MIAICLCPLIKKGIINSYFGYKMMFSSIPNKKTHKRAAAATVLFT